MMLDTDGWTALALSLRVASVATAVSLPLAIWVAWVLARRDFPGKSLLSALVHLPLVLPPVVTGYVLLISFGANGPFGRFFEQVFGLSFAFRWTGAALAAGVMGFPLMVRAIRLAIEAVDSRIEEAAATLGAPRASVFARVTFPLILPGVLAGAVMGFAKAMGEFGATITFVAAIPGETRTLPSAIYGLLQIPGEEAAAVQLVVWATLISVAAVILSELMARHLARRIGAAHAT